MNRPGPTRRVRAVPVVFVAALVLAITLWPVPTALQSRGAESFWCIGCGVQPLTDLLLNLVLFVPLGIALGGTGVTTRSAFLIGASLSLFIELTQIVVPGRDPSVRDLAANAVGAAFGARLWSRRYALLRPTASAARFYGIVASIIALLTLSVGYALLQPSVPHATYFGQWAPRFRDRAYFDGKLLQATLGGEPLPQGAESTSGLLQRKLSDGSLHLEVIIHPGQASWAFAPIAAVVDEHRREIAALGQMGIDAVFRARTHAADLGLATAAVRIRGVLPTSSDPVRIAGERERGAIAVIVRTAGGELREELTLSPGLSWVLLYPGEQPAGSEVPWLSTLWIVLLVLPGSYWLGLSGRRSALGAFAVMVVLALLALPASWNGGIAPWWELIGAGSGVLVGWRLSRR